MNRQDVSELCDLIENDVITIGDKNIRLHVKSLKNTELKHGINSDMKNNIEKNLVLTFIDRRSETVHLRTTRGSDWAYHISDLEISKKTISFINSLKEPEYKSKNIIFKQENLYKFKTKTLKRKTI